MTARTRYQRIPGLFWSGFAHGTNAIYLLHLIEEYDACMSALSVALCPFFFFAARYRTGGPTGRQATLQLAFDGREPGRATPLAFRSPTREAQRTRNTKSVP
jgi:hypothetical protein